MRVALVGAGVVAARYADCIDAQPQLDFAGATDVLPGRAAQLVARHGGTEYESLTTLLADVDLDAVVNLTAPSAHAVVNRPDVADAALSDELPRGLLRLAEERRGRAAETDAVRGGQLGQPVSLCAVERDRFLGVHVLACLDAEANWGRIERWHPTPEALYDWAS